MDEKNHPELQSMESPAFVVNGDAEEVRAEHAMALACALPHASWPSAGRAWGIHRRDLRSRQDQ